MNLPTKQKQNLKHRDRHVVAKGEGMGWYESSELVDATIKFRMGEQ